MPRKSKRGVGVDAYSKVCKRTPGFRGAKFNYPHAKSNGSAAHPKHEIGRGKLSHRITGYLQYKQALRIGHLDTGLEFILVGFDAS
jgi:hypothetical protein